MILWEVPHALLINQKSERVSYFKLLLTALMEQKTNDFQQIITGDESDSSAIIPVIPSRRHHVMNFLNLST
jgi:hypothetical protein